MSENSCQKNKGRVDLTGYKTGKPQLSQDLGVNLNGGFENILSHYLEETEASRYFFSSHRRITSKSYSR